VSSADDIQRIMGTPEFWWGDKVTLTEPVYNNMTGVIIEIRRNRKAGFMYIVRGTDGELYCVYQGNITGED